VFIWVDDSGTIVDAKFRTFGCGSAIASSSVVTEWIKGKHLTEVYKIKNQDIARYLALPPVKLHCRCVCRRRVMHGVHSSLFKLVFWPKML